MMPVICCWISIEVSERRTEDFSGRCSIARNFHVRKTSTIHNAEFLAIMSSDDHHRGFA